jgi:hypothetical protein
LAAATGRQSIRQFVRRYDVWPIGLCARRFAPLGSRSATISLDVRPEMSLGMNGSALVLRSIRDDQETLAPARNSGQRFMDVPPLPGQRGKFLVGRLLRGTGG